jgi:hypothetical protein
MEVSVALALSLPMRVFNTTPSAVGLTRRSRELSRKKSLLLMAF